MWCKCGAILINKKSNKLLINLLDSYLAVWTGLEPATPCVTGRYSNQLNYHTKFCFFIVNRCSQLRMQRYIKTLNLQEV